MALGSGNHGNADKPREDDDSCGIFSFLQTDDHDGDQRIISSCRLNSENFRTVTIEQIFSVNSLWKDRELLYNTVKTYAALTGWKPTLTHKIYIRCSCFQRHVSRIKETKNTSKVSINKQCQWEVRIKSTQYKNQQIQSGIKKGKHKSIPVFAKDVPVMITKASLNTHWYL